MTAITKTHALRVISRAYGPDHAGSLAGRPPDRIDLDNTAHARLRSELGLTPDRLNALGAEL
jgi:hypothetical protein